ncbi:E3 ubiquitin-protein ligase RNF182 isoform X2 [Hippocampus comes]|nr:PREDICTED: E3 ubiquitin-protein ligase RNF182-like isoform X2 [Hippocampus comes]XP_019735979.1 PREDICTED: E3 ubiquitin-protein ligase RNF182-like isoform X2 [Hippocampus comes]
MPSPGSDIARLLPQTADRMTRRGEKTEPSREPQGQMTRWTESLVVTLDELECKICYNRYDTRSRKPKVLACLHRVCAKCLKRMLDTGESSPSVLICPFCRHQTHLPQEEVWLMEDDRHILAVLSCGERARRGGGGGGVPHREVVLNPDSLRGADRTPRSSDCLVITIMELPADSPSSDELRTLNAAEAVALYRRHSSQDSLACDLPTRKCGSWTSRRLPRCLLGALCMVYFSSLPVGIYLLMMAHMWPGVLLVSLVPSTLLLLVLYGFCQCLCHELLQALATRRRDNATIAITSAEDD